MSYLMSRADASCFDLGRITDALASSGADQMGEGDGPDPRQVRPGFTFQWTLDDAEIEIAGDGKYLLIHTDEVTDFLAKFFFQLMSDEDFIFHDNMSPNVLVVKVYPTIDAYGFHRWHVIDSWQELKQIANYEDPEQFF